MSAESQAYSFLESVSGYARAASRSSADRPLRLATVDLAYDPFLGYPDAPPAARVTFDGETTLSGKAYGYVGGFIPWPGTRVFLVPIGNTYVIGGMIGAQTPQGFWSNAAGTESGVELGGGTFYDTNEGLVVAGDVSVAGDLEVTGVGAFLHRQRGVDSSAVTNTTLVTDPLLYLDLGVGNWVVDFWGVYTGTAGDFAVAWTFSGAWTGSRISQGMSPFTINTNTVNDTPSRDSAAQRTSVHGLGTTVPYGANDASFAAGLHETASLSVTTAGRWSIQYAQRTTNAAGSIMRAPSFMTARKV